MSEGHKSSPWRSRADAAAKYDRQADASAQSAARISEPASRECLTGRERVQICSRAAVLCCCTMVSRRQFMLGDVKSKQHVLSKRAAHGLPRRRHFRSAFFNTDLVLARELRLFANSQISILINKRRPVVSLPLSQKRQNIDRPKTKNKNRARPRPGGYAADFAASLACTEPAMRQSGPVS
jgi:hypothetical protein